MSKMFAIVEFAIVKFVTLLGFLNPTGIVQLRIETSEVPLEIVTIPLTTWCAQSTDTPLLVIVRQSDMLPGLPASASSVYDPGAENVRQVDGGGAVGVGDDADGVVGAVGVADDDPPHAMSAQSTDSAAAEAAQAPHRRASRTLGADMHVKGSAIRVAMPDLRLSSHPAR
ncbi:MAG: hypothetical protein ACRD1V_19465 [Vicinamibacterales bacterium]